MTTISERCRALRYGAALLDLLQFEPPIDAELAERARLLATSYPASSVIDALDQGEPIELTSAQVQAIDDTHRFLVDFPCRTKKTRNVIDDILRHFPLPDEGNAGFLFWPRCD